MSETIKCPTHPQAYDDNCEFCIIKKYEEETGLPWPLNQEDVDKMNE